MNNHHHVISTTTKGFIIGQAPPEKSYDIPFSRTRLYSWFSLIGLTQKDISALFNFDALVPTFLGKNGKTHIVPSKNVIEAYAPTLIRKINSSNSGVILSVGKIATQAILNVENIELTDVIGRKFVVVPFGVGTRKLTIIPFPHPSGLSSWVYQENNILLLHKALEIVKQSISN